MKPIRFNIQEVTRCIQCPHWMNLPDGMGQNCHILFYQKKGDSVISGNPHGIPRNCPLRKNVIIQITKLAKGR
jgi:hypothetical protein